MDLGIKNKTNNNAADLLGKIININRNLGTSLMVDKDLRDKISLDYINNNKAITTREDLAALKTVDGGKIITPQLMEMVNTSANYSAVDLRVHTKGRRQITNHTLAERTANLIETAKALGDNSKLEMDR